MRPGRLLLALLLLLAPQVVAGGTPPAYAAATVSVSIDSISPLVSIENAPITLTGTIRNSGTTAAPLTDIVVRASSVGAQSRTAVSDWASSNGPADGRVLGQTRTTAPILPGGTARFSITVTDLGTGLAARWGALPVAVSAGGAHAHTFLGYQVRKEYVPVQLAVTVPILTPADPALWGSGETRTQAWTDVAKSTSRPSRIMAATSAHQVDWLVDGTLLTPAATAATASDPTATPTPTPTATANPSFVPTSVMAYADSPAEVAARETVRTALTAGRDAHGTLTLPPGDPDLYALSRLPRTSAALAREISATAAALPGRTLVGWAADGAWTSEVERTAGQLLPRVQGAPAPTIVSSAAVTLEAPGLSPGARVLSSAGTPLMISDASLSQSLTEGATASGGATKVAEFMADSAALVAERAGTERAVQVVADRSLDPDVAAFDRFLTGVESIPWLTPTPGSALTTISTPRAVPGTAEPTPPPGPMTTDTLAETQGLIVAGGQIREDAATYTGRSLQGLLAATGTGWRTQTDGWSALSKEVGQAALATVSGVQVEPKQITFLAESGRIQITVENTLNVAVHDVELTVTPDNPKLRLDQPTTTLQIGPNARTTVTLSATALAAGSVPLRTTLTAPDGTVLSNQATVQIQVTPTGNWIYGVVGGLGLVALIAGLWRSRRARRATSEAGPTSSGTVSP